MPASNEIATDQFFFKTAQEMAQGLRRNSDALERTVAIAGRCNVKLMRCRIRF